MSSTPLKSLFLLVVVLLIPFCLSGCEETNRDIEGTIQIFEIKNTEEIYGTVDKNVVTIRKHYMIINPPEDLHELKKVVENFHQSNPINREIADKENKIRQVEAYFYRESKKLPKDWQPNEGYFNTDRIEHHKSDLIASIHWSESEPQTNYYIMRKTSDKNNYGAIIERIKYIDDKLID